MKMLSTSFSSSPTVLLATFVAVMYTATITPTVMALEKGLSIMCYTNEYATNAEIIPDLSNADCKDAQEQLIILMGECAKEAKTPDKSLSTGTPFVPVIQQSLLPTPEEEEVVEPTIRHHRRRGLSSTSSKQHRQLGLPRCYPPEPGEMCYSCLPYSSGDMPYACCQFCCLKECGCTCGTQSGRRRQRELLSSFSGTSETTSTTTTVITSTKTADSTLPTWTSTLYTGSTIEVNDEEPTVFGTGVTVDDAEKLLKSATTIISDICTLEYKELIQKWLDDKDDDDHDRLCLGTTSENAYCRAFYHYE